MKISGKTVTFKVTHNPCCEAFPFCNCGTDTVTIGSTKYLVSAALLKRIKKACSIAHIPWQTIAARPSEALSFCERVERMSQD